MLWLFCFAEAVQIYNSPTSRMVSQQKLDELQKIIKEEYGQDLEMDQVSQIGNGIVGYFDLLAKIHHKSNEP
jgi:hypothetical protein